MWVIQVHGNSGQYNPMMAQQMQGVPPMQMGQNPQQQQMQQQQANMRVGANFAAGPNQPRGPGGQFASMNPSMAQHGQQQPGGWPQQRQQNPGMPQNNMPFNQFQNRQQMMMMQQQQSHPSNAGGQ
ncbi:hypothetical protein B9Z55_010734 [Caenorhabditis nigoni]|uniref:Uncharacterized protein n=1 Tax=Caenorhabditis nigoni TaxID=1611254 RepID=A0A2G5UH18_9PELO|nr:hypothetical protein B9Z55_010734 [Caenorhabditis nigoni]